MGTAAGRPSGMGAIVLLAAIPVAAVGAIFVYLLLQGHEPSGAIDTMMDTVKGWMSMGKR